MLRTFRLFALFLLMPLTACGVVSDDAQSGLSLLPSALTKAKDCMVVHGAMLQAGFAPMGVSEGAPDADETIEHMRGLADALPLNDVGQPTLRDAFRNTAEMVAGVKGKGLKAAGALVDSEPYLRHVGVLGQWYTSHCNKEGEDPSAG